MRKVVLWLSLSIDGFMSGPNGELDWNVVDDEFHTYVNRELATMGAFLEGRVTWQLMADYWPTADQDPDASPPVVEFASIWRDMPKVVYSRTLQEAGWNTVIRRVVDPEEIEEMKRQEGGDLVVGGPNLAATFAEHDLIDEYRLYIHPVLIAEGRRLFPPVMARTKVRLVDTRRFGSGVVLLRYQRPDG